MSHRRRPWAALAVLVVSACLASAAETAPRAAPVKPADWQSASADPLRPGEIDQLITRELREGNLKPAPLTTDEQFVRRLHLDLTGKPPSPADIRAFVADTDPARRARLVDKLLASDAFARHWARFWRDVMAARLTDFRGRVLARSFEQWLTEQLRSDRGWDQIARDLLTFAGEARFDDTSGKSGAAFFLGSHNGADATAEMAAETSRVFLGIQINCAQCHDHPSDLWKREQFHELAAYFVRARPRPIREENRQVGITMGGSGGGRPGGFGGRFGGGGEYRMPGKDDPRQSTVVHPRFLTGESASRGLGDEARRKSLADSLTGKNNPWFAAAFVNRVWGELMGQSFYAGVDDMGPQKDAVYGPVLARVAASFRGSDYNVKALFRAVLTTETYQRQIRLGEVPGEHLQFAAAYPTRLRADAVWEGLVGAVGTFDRGGFGGPRRGPGGGGPLGGRFGGLEAQFKAEFAFDPSLKAEDVEGSIQQALLLMNNRQLNDKIQARGTNTLARILADHAKDADAVDAVYLRALSRKPTDRERQKCLAYIDKVGSRAEAFEDLLWALINSTEFQTRR